MFCECEQIEHSFKEKPFPVPGGYKQNTTYECMCGQRWWCHNDYFCLWSKINRNDEFTWQNVQRGCKVPVGIGNTSNTMDSEDVCVLPQTEFSDYEKEVPFPILSMKRY